MSDSVFVDEIFGTSVYAHSKSESNRLMPNLKNCGNLVLLGFVGSAIGKTGWAWEVTNQ